VPLGISGVHGEIRWSYYLAGRIQGYTLARHNQQWTLTANVVESDAYKMAQRPLLFAAPTQRGVLRWPIVHCRLTAAGRLEAELGEPIP
jgi:hypothetical protein